MILMANMSSPNLLESKAQPLVSVCMITYNHEPYIAQAIEGVLTQQTAFPFELIIGEDCSTDGTRKIVFSYQKKYPDVIRVVTSGKNVGSKMNSFRTEEACQGKYIAYCEGDDYWHDPQKLQMQVEILESNPEVSLVHSEHDLLETKSGRRIFCFHKYCGRLHAAADDPDNFFVDVITYKYHIVTCTVCIRASLMHRLRKADTVLYADKRFPIGDMQRWGELSRIGKFVYTNKSLAMCRVLAESMSHTANLQKYVVLRCKSTDLQLYLCAKYNIPEGTMKRVRDLQVFKHNCYAIVTGDRNTVERLHSDPKFHFAWHQELLRMMGRYNSTRMLAKFALYFWLKYVVKRLS